MLGLLPTEVLVPIFRACRQPHYEATVLQLRLLALVCRRFRDILVPLRYENVGYWERWSHNEPWHSREELDCSMDHPFAYEFQHNAWKTALVRHIEVFHKKLPITYLPMFPNLASLVLSHDRANAALLQLPLQCGLFPNLRAFELGDWDIDINVTIEGLSRFWIQPKLEEFTIFSSDVKGACISPLAMELPPVKVLKLWECHVDDSGFSSLLKNRGAESIIVTECFDALHRTIDAAGTWLTDLMLIEDGGVKDGDVYSLNPTKLKRLSVDVRTFLAWEYGHNSLRRFGRRLGQQWERKPNQLDMLNLEKLTIIFDGLRDFADCGYEECTEMLWTPCVFRKLVASAQQLAPGIKKIVYQFYTDLYELLLADFEPYIEGLRQAGADEGLDIEFKFFNGHHTPPEAHLYVLNDERTPEQLKEYLESLLGVDKVFEE